MRVQGLFDLKGKLAIVTGGGRGIGKFVACGLAEAGANLSIASRRIKNCLEAAEEFKKLGIQALPVECDMEKAGDIENLVDLTMKTFGRIDILVNNAGTTWGAPTLEYPLDRWDKIMAVNVRGPFTLCQKVAKIMIANGGGKIINIASVMGLSGAPEETHPAIAYNSSKGALITMTKDLAIKLAPHNIQVNAIAPGFFRTDMMAWVEGERFKSVKAQLIEDIPMKRSAGEDDIKGLAVLLSSAASNYMTGEIIRVDGGLLAQ